ncbi:hypothetical protein NP233_g4970 [Leucocoprinus birnbaumii]|uniref:F-box domain-containing protein n=1 Tax=Leucocoprinus birnbaumii TaxID=56174 RepID=A0AAD5VXE6_9AGAR|nr:hypothetical protein NP233_g4970 [Leucocoprinus birnbaumii]
MVLWDLHHTFPTELLSEIFLNLIASQPSTSPTPTNTIHHPLLVSHICSHWRTAALATPRLWARLFIQLGLSKAESQAALVRAWMERSGGCPLTIYVFWEDPPFASTHPVLECLMQHSTRWKEMFFYLPFTVFRRFGKVAGKVPLLTDLSLGTDTDAQDMITGADEDKEEDGDGDDDEDEGDDGEDDGGSDSATSSSSALSDPGSYQLQMFKSAPKLASLECVNLSPFLFTFPWDNLTNIPLMAVTIEECLSILHQATSLVKAGFIFLTTSSSPVPSPPSIAAPVVTPTGATTTTAAQAAIAPPPIVGPTSTRGLRPIHHPSLKQFSILTSPWDESIDLTPLFPLLSLPNLLSLTICNLKSHFGTSGFTSFLSRLYSLQTLHLRKTALSDQNLVAGLRVVPTVEKLVVHPLIEGYGPPSVTDVVFDELRWKSWVVDGEYTEFDENVVETEEEDDDTDDDEGYGGSDRRGSGDSGGSGSGPALTSRKQRKRSNSILPLLPRLTSIEVKLDNTTADAFIHMIHSRRTSVHFPSKRYRYKKARSPSGEEEGESSGLVVVAEDEDGEDEAEDDEIDKPSILEHVRIRYSEPLHGQFISELEDLQRDGLKIELDYMNENGGIEFVRHFIPRSMFFALSEY